MVKKYREQTVQKMTFSPISVNEIQTGVKVSREIKRMHGFESTEERVQTFSAICARVQQSGSCKTLGKP